MLTGNMEAGSILRNCSSYFVSIPLKVKRIPDSSEINFILSPNHVESFNEQQISEINKKQQY